MAQATNLSTISRFHNLSNEARADALGTADAALKGAEAECKALKDVASGRVARGHRREPRPAITPTQQRKESNHGNSTHRLQNAQR